MENKNIIIILLILIVVLGVILGAMLLPSFNTQKDSKITITSDKTLYEGDNLTLKLTDLNKTPIKKASVNVSITDKKGKVVVNKTVKTNSKGAAHVKLDLDKGKYTVNVTFGGNENYTGNTTSKNITIKEEEVETEVSSSPSTSSTYEPQTYASGLTDDEIKHISNEIWMYVLKMALKVSMITKKHGISMKMCHQQE